MAERLKVFVNKNITNADILPDGSIPLITTLANEQAVIKSIEVNANTINNSLGYMINNDGFTIAEDLVEMQGSEIVDNSKVVSMVTNTNYTNNLILNYTLTAAQTSIVIPVNSISLFTNSNASVTNYNTIVPFNLASGQLLNNPNDSLYLPVDKAYKSVALLKTKYPYTVSTSSQVINYDSVHTTYSTSSMSQQVWFRIVGNNAFYFYWDGNSNTILFKASISGTTVGAWSIVDSTNYSTKALDVENNIVYYVNGTTLYTYDLNTQILTNIGAINLPSAPSTYTTSTFSNGVFFIIISSSYISTMYFYNTITASSGVINLDTVLSVSSYMHLAVAYNSSEDKWYISTGHPGIAQIYTVTGSMSGTKSSTYLGNQTLLPLTIYSGQGVVVGNKYGNMLYACTAANGLVAGFAVVTWANNTATVIKNYPYTFSINYHSPMDINLFTGINKSIYTVSPASQTVHLDINNDTIPFNAQLKISGVAITEGI